MVRHAALERRRDGVQAESTLSAELSQKSAVAYVPFCVRTYRGTRAADLPPDSIEDKSHRRTMDDDPFSSIASRLISKWLARLWCRDAALPRLDSRSHNGRFVHGRSRPSPEMGLNPGPRICRRARASEKRGVEDSWGGNAAQLWTVSPITPFSSPRKAPRPGLRLKRASQRTHTQWYTLPIGATVDLAPCLPVSQAGHASWDCVRWKVAGCVGRPRWELTHFAEAISASPLYSPLPISACIDEAVQARVAV